MNIRKKQTFVNKAVSRLFLLSALCSCGHIEKNNESLISNICSNPESVVSGTYDTKFDLVSTSHGSLIYFQNCPEETFNVNLSIVMPRDQLDSDFAHAVYRNATDPSTVLRLEASVDYRFLKTEDSVGGSFTILSIDKWSKAGTLMKPPV